MQNKLIETISCQFFPPLCMKFDGLSEILVSAFVISSLFYWHLSRCRRDSRSNVGIVVNRNTENRS
ncbi:hypothetical protein PUN28_003633 [Cardiocondyla obscurior]|uniref:Uncharacterized protein n=1 Tax=Cardiocondyla obscurior TaxID=286306 RepID=A0AAW2GMV0_9HYME